MFFDFPGLDYFSLIIGILGAVFFLWVFNFLYKEIKKWELSKPGEQTRANKNKDSLALWEKRYREEIYLKAQSNHLASPLFSLDEIVVPPRFLAPQSRSQELGKLSRDDIFSSLPFIPGWPELATKYKTPTIDVNDLLSSDADFVILGYPGTGKSVALAYITSQLAKMDVGNATTSVPVPFYFHISELPKLYYQDEVLEILAERVTAGYFYHVRTKDYLKEIFKEERAIVLIDGMDELSSSAFTETSSFISSIKTLYPNVKIITTASPHFLGKLVALSFIPITIAGWTETEKQILSSSWGNLWNEKIIKYLNTSTGDFIDPVVVNTWLNKSNCNNPFSLTLALLGAYIGDASGQSYLETLQAYISRSTPIKTLGLPLEKLSRQLIFSGTLKINKESYQELRYTPVESENTQNGLRNKDIQSKIVGVTTNSSDNKSLITAQGINLRFGWIFQNIPAQQPRFSHPIIPAYLAGKSFTEGEIGKVIAQPPWLGRDISLQIFTYTNNSSFVINKFKISKPPLHNDLFIIGRWLHDAPVSQSWGEQVISHLINLVKDDNQTLAIRCKAVISLVDLINNPEIFDKFRDLQISSSTSHQFLGCIGSGALKDLRSIKTLSQLALEPSTHVRNSACLALAVIGSQDSIEALSQILLKGNDFQKYSAAEALSLNMEFGHAILRDALSLKEDLMVRRASVFGIAMIREEWTSELLSQLQIEEPEWIVKSAASEALESQKYFPAVRRKKSIPVSETPWIIAYASKLGVGVVPTKSPVDILLTALKRGSLDEKIDSLQYLSNMPSSSVFEALYFSLYNGEPDLRESTFSALNEMAMSGIDLPTPDF